MNNADFQRSVKLVWRYATGINVGETFSNPVSLKLSEEYRREAYSSEVNYESLYLTGMRNSDYNILLTDYSFMQFSSTDEGKLRSAYFPNPFFGSSAEIMNEIGEKHAYVIEGLVDIETFLQEVSEARASEVPPLIRYEYHQKSHVELCHPASHIHVGYHSDNRWAVERILTPEAFGLFIMKLFYRREWEKAGLQQFGDTKKSVDEILMAAKEKCPLVQGDKFTPKEKKQFFLG